MRLRRLRILRLPGLRDPLEIPFEAPRDEGGAGAPDLTIVTGRNASGKTSILRAVRCLLDEDFGGSGVHVEAEFDARGGGIEVARLGTGRSGPTGRLPGPAKAPFYLVRHDELLRDPGSAEDEVAREVMRLLAGGFDLDGAVEALRARIERALRGRTVRSLERKRTDARRAYESAVREHEQLDEDRRRLGRMERELEEERESADRLPRIEAALQALELRDELAAAEERLASFPEGMEAVRSDDAETLDRLREEERNLRREIADREQEREELRGLGRVEGSRLGRLSDLVDRIRTAVASRDETRREAQAAENELSELAREAGTDPERTPTPEALAEARRAGDQWRLAREREAREAQAVAPSVRYLAFGSGAVAVLAGFWFTSRGQGGAGAVLVGVGIVALIVGFALGSGGSRKTARREREQAEEEAHEALAAAGLPESALERWETLAPLWERMVDVHRRLAEIRGRAKTHEEEVARLFARWREEVGDLEGAPDPQREPPSALRAWVDDLRTGIERFAVLGGEIDQRKRRLEQIRADIRRLFERLGLTEDADGVDDEVRRRVERLSEWEDAKRQVGDLRSRLREVERAIENDRELIDLAEAGDRDGLQGLQRRAAEARDRARKLGEDVARLRERVEQAERGTALEEKGKKVAQLEEQLARSRRLELLRACLDFLRARATKALDEQAPELLERIRCRFAKITRHRWNVRIVRGPDGRPCFAAYETSHPEEARRLDELSTGTRLQLMLAARVAYLEELEQGGEPFPLLVDEALANADPERLDAAAAALAEIARTRQVIYLTAQPAEFRAFRTHVPSLHWVDLDELRGEQRTIDPDDLEPPPVSLPPPPGESSPEDYAREIGATPVDLHGPPDAIHLFHLLRDDLDRLHRWLLRGVETVGQIESFLRSESRRDGDPSDLKTRMALATAFLECARIGRPPRVDRRVLEESGAISNRFIDEVSELAEQLEGDGRRLLEALEPGSPLRPAGFQERKRQELEDYLREHGRLVDEEPLGLGELVGRVAARVGVEPVEPWRTLVAGLFAAAGLDAVGGQPPPPRADEETSEAAEGN